MDTAESAETAEADAPAGKHGRWRRRTRGPRSWWRELPILLGVALLLSLGAKTFLVQAFSIPSGSMQGTLDLGDRVLVDKLSPWFGAEPHRGDVVVFHDPGDWLGEESPGEGGNAALRDVRRVLSLVGLAPSGYEKDLIKRVIAVGGDTVRCDAGGPVEVNGVPLDEPYLYPGATPCDDDPVGTVTVPAGHLWVMGDHRNGSWDSRYHQLQHPGDGFVPVGNVVGRAFAVVWPVLRWTTLPDPATFHQPRLDHPSAGAAPAHPAPAAAAVPVRSRSAGAHVRKRIRPDVRQISASRVVLSAPRLRFDRRCPPVLRVPRTSVPSNPPRPGDRSSRDHARCSG